MPVWLVSLLSSLVPNLLSWFFSGSKSTTVVHTAGLDGLDRDTLSGKKDLSDLAPALLLALGFSVFFCGCSALNVGGSHESHEVIMVEPGDTLEIAEDRKIQVLVSIPDDKAPGKLRQIVTQKNMAGSVAMPKSVYRELRAKAFPAAPAPSTQTADPNAKAEIVQLEKE